MIFQAAPEPRSRHNARPVWQPACGFERRGASSDIPPRQDIRRFTRSFRTWRDRLMAEVMWLTGMRNAEVCWLPAHALPDDPGARSQRKPLL